MKAILAASGSIPKKVIGGPRGEEVMMPRGTESGKINRRKIGPVARHIHSALYRSHSAAESTALRM